MNSGIIRMSAGGFLFILWTVLVWFGHADPQLILAIQAGLAAIFGYHGITSLQLVPKDTTANQPAQRRADSPPVLQPSTIKDNT